LRGIGRARLREGSDLRPRRPCARLDASTRPAPRSGVRPGADDQPRAATHQVGRFAALARGKCRFEGSCSPPGGRRSLVLLAAPCFWENACAHGPMISRLASGMGETLGAASRAIALEVGATLAVCWLIIDVWAKDAWRRVQQELAGGGRDDSTFATAEAGTFPSGELLRGGPLRNLAALEDFLGGGVGGGTISPAGRRAAKIARGRTER